MQIETSQQKPWQIVSRAIIFDLLEMWSLKPPIPSFEGIILATCQQADKN